MPAIEPDNKTLVFLLASLGLIVLPHALNIPAALFLFFLLALAWRLLGVWYKKLLPGRYLLFIATFAGVLLLASQHRGILGRDAGTALFVTALGLKLLEIRRERDLYLVVYLAFFVAATQFLFLQNIFMAAYILIVCCLLLASLICINSRKPELPAAVKTAAVIILQAVPLMAVMFVVFPRFEAPQWVLFVDKPKSLTGLDDNMSPGTISQLGKSDALAFRVKFDGELPPPALRYWRGPVFTQTDGVNWTPRKTWTYDKSARDEPEFSGRPYAYTLMLEPQKHNWVYALDLPSSYPDSLRQKSDYQLVGKKKPTERAEYRIVSHVDYKTPEIGRKEKEVNLQLPDKPSPRIEALLGELGGGGPLALARNTLMFFNRNDFFYTLNPPLYPENPVEAFLFEGRRGFCEHFATAFVFLMRAANVPARVVTGYQGGEYNEVGGFLEVRQAHAHAWAEIHIDGRGWVRIDPTSAVAPERIEQEVNVDTQIATGEVSFSGTGVRLGMMATWFKNAHYLWESVDYHWQRWIINYNNTSRNNLLSALGIDGIRGLALWLGLFIGLFAVALAFFV
ncbi:MAG: transglutaminase family protein, partial [Gammaproteobacteria bacterium]